MIILELTFYGVTSEGVIVVPDIPAPQIRAQVFELVDTRGIHSCEELIELIDCCAPLQIRFKKLAQQYLDEHASGSVHFRANDRVKHSAQHPLAGLSARMTNQMRVSPSTVARGGHAKILQALQRDLDSGWRQWIEYSTDACLQFFLEHVQDWLNEDIDWDELEHFDTLRNGQRAALNYFENLHSAILQAVGVQIVDSCAPGSYERAAKLRKSIDQANQIAQWLSQDFRFELCDVGISGGAHG